MNANSITAQTKGKKCRIGQAYTTNARYKKRPAKTCELIDCSKCRLECQEKISENERKTINEQY